jgi:O-antigen ligase
MPARRSDARFTAYDAPVLDRMLGAWREAWRVENQTQTALFACALLLLVVATVFGGASQGNALSLATVEVASLPLLFVGLYLVFAGTAPRGALVPLILLVLIVAVPILQLVPLPASIWTRLPGRGPIAQVLDVTRLGRPSLPFSMAPQETWRSLLALTPPAAMLVGGLFLTGGQRRVMAVCWLVLAIVSLGIGLLQLIGGQDSRFYFYDITNPGSLVGLFSNRNNQAAFFYSLMPLAAVFAAQFNGDLEDRRTIPALLAVLYFFVALVGVAATRSRAGIAITAVALIGSAAIIVRGGVLRRHWRMALGMGAGSVVVIGVIALFAAGPILDRFSSGSADPRFTGWPLVLAQAQRFLPLGSGIGSFQTVYLAAEPLNDVSPIYFNHAHDDYLELLLETGLVGVALFAVFAAWLAARIARIWTSRGDIMGGACTLVILLLMAHSLVEYPLRTEALAVLFAFACATIAVWRPDERAAGLTRAPAEGEPRRAHRRSHRRVRP